jgi:NAD(P)H-dependent FMN reductase
MPHIAIISSSVRRGRNSHRVALFFKNFLETNNLATAEILDLNEYNFPIFHERLKHEPDPAENVLEFSGKIKSADGVIVVTPEYNGGYPASIKNVVDLLYDEWHRKPLVISTVSDGQFGGTQVLVSLHFSLWKIRAWMVPAMFPVPDVDTTFKEDGTPVDQPGTEKRARRFIDELLWCIEAKKRMDAKA